MSEYDLIIKNGNIFGGGLFLQRETDMAIKDGKIVKIDKSIQAEADTVIDGTGKLVSPGFVDSHMHIDKALLADDDGTTTLEEALLRSDYKGMEKYSSMSEEDILQDILTRSSRIVEMAISHGTTCLKSTPLVNKTWGMLAHRAMVILKERYRDKINILTATPYDAAFDGEWRAAAEAGEIDFVGGYANIDFKDDGINTESDDYKSAVDRMFSLAKEYDLPIDMHCNESDAPNIDAFLYVIEKTMDMQWQDRVTCGHVTALYADGLDPDVAITATSRTAKAHVNVTTLTSCNLYLMDWKRRGTTRVGDLLTAGVNVSIGSDNIRDAFRPFGNADLVEEALLTAQVHKFSTHAELAKVFGMITYNPAFNCLLPAYGTLPGCDADLVILDAPDTTEAIIRKAKAKYVIKSGRIVARDGKVL